MFHTLGAQVDYPEVGYSLYSVMWKFLSLTSYLLYLLNSCITFEYLDLLPFQLLSLGVKNDSHVQHINCI